MAPLLQLCNVSRRYLTGDQAVHALDDVSLTLPRGEFAAVTGPSGSGKTTLLNVIGCLDRPDEGSYHLAGQDVAALDADELALVRNRRIGFVFQSYNLLPRVDALDNVALPLLYRGYGWREARLEASAALRRVDAAALARRTPLELSGGQQQRLSIARAIIGAPDIILADEPTGALERHSGDAVMELLQELNAQGQTIIVITHDPRVARVANVEFRMLDGRLLRSATP